MCGIGGFCLNPKDKNKIDPDHLAAILLMNLEERGRHSTGQAWRNSKGVIKTKKAPLPANVWVKRGEHRNGATTRILHTRYATQGSPENPANNHPICTGRITGTHNGTLSNDDELFDLLNCKRIGQVDSEAIFALLEYGNMPVTDALELPAGRAAVAWLDADDRDNTIHLARMSGSPLAVGQTPNGSFVYASTMSILLASCEQAGVDLAWTQSVTEGNYFRITDGRLVTCEVFKPAAPALRPRSYTTRSVVTTTTGKKRKGKAKRSAGRKVVAGYYLNDAGEWVDEALEVSRPVRPADYEWDDVEAMAEADAAAEEAIVFGSD